MLPNQFHPSIVQSHPAHQYVHPVSANSLSNTFSIVGEGEAEEIDMNKINQYSYSIHEQSDKLSITTKTIQQCFMVILHEYKQVLG